VKCATFMLLLALASLGGVQQSRADYIPFSGSVNSGTIVTPSGTEPWSVRPINSSDVWGMPGAGQGLVPWTGGGSERVVTVTFTNLPNGVTISPSLGVGTQMGVQGFAFSFWIPTFSNDDRTVTFTAPSAPEQLSPGTDFFMNVTFTGNVAEGGLAFTGAFDPQDASPNPEPTSITLLATGIFAAGGFGLVRRRRRAAAAS
jgi:hypothetical protein